MPGRAIVNALLKGSNPALGERAGVAALAEIYGRGVPTRKVDGPDK
jgi:hypothetical protein